MKIKLMTVYVDDQDKALRFYTAVLGFAKKTDFSQGPYRWLTLASAEEPDGAELQLERNDDPAAKAFQQARFGPRGNHGVECRTIEGNAGSTERAVQSRSRFSLDYLACDRARAGGRVVQG